MSTIASWAHGPSPRATWALGQALVILGVIAAFVLVPLVSSASLEGGMAAIGLGILAAVTGVGLKHHVQRRRAGDVDADIAEGASAKEAPSDLVVITLLVMGTLSMYYCTR